MVTLLLLTTLGFINAQLFGNPHGSIDCNATKLTNTSLSPSPSSPFKFDIEPDVYSINHAITGESKYPTFRSFGEGIVAFIFYIFPYILSHISPVLKYG